MFNPPRTYNEKLQWLKLYDHNPQYVMYVDKYAVKNIIGNHIGYKYIIPTLKIWDNVNEIDFDSLPSKFVLKCTHDSGSYIICKNKCNFNKARALKKLKTSLKRNFYYHGREWPYKNIKPRIIAETYIGSDTAVPDDYKFYTFNGKIDSVMVCKNREQGYPQFFFFDLNWQRLYYQINEPSINYEILKPENFDEMIAIAKNIAVHFIEARIDLYNINGNIYFGEITLFNQSGFDTDITFEIDQLWGKKIQLPFQVKHF